MSRFSLLSRMAPRQLQWYWSRMTDVLVYALVPLSLAVVAVILLLGFINFARGGSPWTSQKLMRWRVLMQFVALVVIMLTIWIMGR
jgi:Hypoxia induced protein conserved region